MAFIAGGGWFTGTYPVRIPYEINVAVGAGIIQAGIALWNAVSNESGVELLPRTNEASYIVFVDAGPQGSCNSPVGRQPTQPQPVTCNLSGGGNAAVIAHEIGHAIGLLHEHQRPDRDQNITLTEDVTGSNAINGPNYQLIPELTPLTNVLSLPDETIATVVDVYDCASVMHYPVGSFQGVTTAPGVGCPSLAGAQTAISQGDINGVRALYGGGTGTLNVTYTRYPISSDGWHLTRARRARREALRRRRGLRGTLIADVEARRNPPAGSGQASAPAGFYDDVFARIRDLSGFPIFFGYDFEARDVLVYWEF